MDRTAQYRYPSMTKTMVPKTVRFVFDLLVGGWGLERAVVTSAGKRRNSVARCDDSQFWLVLMFAAYNTQPEGGEAPKPGQLDRKPFKLHVEAGAFTDSEIIVMLGEVRYACMYVGRLGRISTVGR